MSPSPLWAEPLLAAIAGGASLYRAAQAAGVTHPAVYQFAQRNPDFAERLAAARGLRRDPGARNPRRPRPAWAAPLLDLVAGGATVPEAAARCGVTRQSVYALAARDVAFSEALAAARAQAPEPSPPPQRAQAAPPPLVELPPPALPLCVDEGDAGPVALLVDLVRVAWADAAAGDARAQAWLSELQGRPVGPEEAGAHVAAALGLPAAPAEPWAWWAAIALAELRAGRSQAEAVAAVGLTRQAVHSLSGRRPCFAAAVRAARDAA